MKSLTGEDQVTTDWTTHWKVRRGLKYIFMVRTSSVEQTAQCEQFPGGSWRGPPPDISCSLEPGWPIALLVALALPALIWLISIIYTHPGAQPRIGTLAQITPGYYSSYHKSLKAT